jgi:phosphoribosylformimino-5-aminoimidazole carboxamide ribotide isomerase
MKIIPAIDIINGKCVRLSQGDYASQKIYNKNPLEVAKSFEDSGIKFLHLVDLDGAKSKKIINHRVLYNISNQTNLKIDFGGGLQSDNDLKIAFENGASQITGGSIAVSNPILFSQWILKYGADKIILGADCKNRKIAIHGWMNESEIDIIDFIKNYESKGIQNVISTDVSKDGMLQGTSNELYIDIMLQTKIKLIASGGVSSINDLQILKEIGCEGVIIGKAIYEQKITLKELSKLC